MSFNSYYISTTIPYVNSNPHIGHAQEFVLADAITRYYKGLGKIVHFQSGTDDNATKNVLSAKQNNIPVQQFIDINFAKFKDLQLGLEVFPNKFVRTSSSEHYQAVKRFLSILNKDDIYESNYQGNYCSGCEDFLSDTELTDNGLCPDHLREPDFIQEKNIFFRLSKYQNQIAELIESEKIRITPSYKKNEILSFIRKGLTDISLSRSSARTLGWGIPYPEVAGQTVYVWIDALINYLTGIGFGNNDEWQNRWNKNIYKIHVIGKNVWKFHAIYWPALLLSAGIDLPNEIIIHGFLTNQGTKISKSLNNGTDPIDLVNRYGSDAIRFYLLGSLNYQNDSDFSEKNLAQAYNSELANKFGNLVSRVLTLANSVTVQYFKLDNHCSDRSKFSNSSSSSSSSSSSAPGSAAGSAGSLAKPLLPPDIKEFFIPPAVASFSDKPRGIYQPLLLASAQVRFVDTKLGIDTTVDRNFLVPPSSGAVFIDFNKAKSIKITTEALSSPPAEGFSYGDPSELIKPSNYKAWSKDFVTYLVGKESLKLACNKVSGEVSRPGESERDFRIRVQQSNTELRDQALAKLREKYASRINDLSDRIRLAQQKVAVEQAEARQHELNSALSIGATVLGALMSRRPMGATNIGRATSAARSVSRAAKQKEDVGRAEENLAVLESRLHELNLQFQGEAQAIADRFGTSELSTIAIAAKKTNINVRFLGLAWVVS